jgi:hypothetical protein
MQYWGAVHLLEKEIPREIPRTNGVESFTTERGVFGGIFKYGYLGVVENGLFAQYTEKTIVIVGEQKSVE